MNKVILRKKFTEILDKEEIPKLPKSSSKKEKVDIMVPVKKADADKDNISHEEEEISDDVIETIEESDDVDTSEESFFESLGDW